MNFRIIRNTQVITDSDLAKSLDLLPKSFISFFKRNISVFPAETYFKLTEEEKQDLVKIIVSRMPNVYAMQNACLMFLPQTV